MNSSATSDCAPGKPGDLVIFKRRVYDHYAVNVGNCEIAHVTSTGRNYNSYDAVGSSGAFLSSDSSGGMAVIQKELYANFVKPGDSVTVEDGQWRGKTAFPGKVVADRALSRVGETGYNILTNNCEHFARESRYGLKGSDQAANLVTSGATATGLCLVSLRASLALYEQYNKKIEQIKERINPEEEE